MKFLVEESWDGVISVIFAQTGEVLNVSRGTDHHSLRAYLSSNAKLEAFKPYFDTEGYGLSKGPDENADDGFIVGKLTKASY